ncbi:MAG: FAD-dependent oxidoreductase [Firmicutes bacterium HGW-Firmicutes-9]|jgi:prolycopene isomerase|nr:MAG: FAD-dependent oxidoreductase [Firmicutes bacterium HGW-Firmicutes-9]
MGYQQDHYDAIIIGGGLSGLTAASLLAKKGLRVAVVDKSDQPGGCCGIFRRGDTTFDQGSAMLYGFGEHGFNAHRFVMNCLEEPIDVLKHDLLYVVNYDGHRVRFYPDVEQFSEELARVFPTQKQQIKRFYRDMSTIYRHVMVESPSYTTADETPPKDGLKGMLRHPVSYIRFLTLLNKSAKSLLQRYFTDPAIFNFFDKLTSTYCYATVEEAPAVLAAVMFVDNHVGGSWYPAGSTLFLPGKLEKAIEEHGGDLVLGREVVSILFNNNKPSGVLLDDGTRLMADDIVYSGTVWNLYEKLIDPKYSSKKRRDWAKSLVPTYPSVVLYTEVDRAVITADTSPVEMLVGNPEQIDDSEITMYTFSLDDRSICPDDVHTVIAIGPTFQPWAGADKETYKRLKAAEQQRLISVLERRFPGFSAGVRHAELSTPRTIERYTMKNGGAVAGPKQMLGQHMFKRLHTKSEWDNLFYCGESTVMGTGTPTVTTSGLSAANTILKKRGIAPFVYDKDQKNFVRQLPVPFTAEQLYADEPENTRGIMQAAMRCRFCEHPTCCGTKGTDIPGIMRRVAVGNFTGAKKRLSEQPAPEETLTLYESRCIRRLEGGTAVAIKHIIESLTEEQA